MNLLRRATELHAIDTQAANSVTARQAEAAATLAEKTRTAKQRLIEFAGALSTRGIATLPLYVVELTMRRRPPRQEAGLDLVSRAYTPFARGWIAQERKDPYEGATIKGLFVTTAGALHFCREEQTTPPVDGQFAESVRRVSVPYAKAEFDITRILGEPDPGTSVVQQNEAYFLPTLGTPQGFDILARGLARHGVTG